MSALVTAAMAEIDRHRRALELEFGWTLLAVAAREDRAGRALVLQGEVALPRMIGGVEGRLAPLLPAGWRIDVAGVSARAGLGWRTPGPGVARLWRAPGVGAWGHVLGDRSIGVSGGTGGDGHVLGDRLSGRSGGTGGSGRVLGDRLVGMSWGTGGDGHVLGDRLMKRGTGSHGYVLGDRCGGTGAEGHGPGLSGMGGLSSELLATDGPVLLLAAGPGAWSLVRAGDGTVGWLHGALTRARAPVRMKRRRVLEATALRRLTLRLRAHLGVPYLLGGTTRRHIDCSGLLQRCVREALGVVLPRHSTDQAARWVAPGRSLGEPGDLLFMAGVDAAQCHVGVVLRGARPGSRTLLHASARRGQVVEEPLEQCLARVEHVQHAELAQLLELA